MLSVIFSLVALVVVAVSASPIELEGLEKRGLATVYTSCKNANQVALTFDDGGWIYEAHVVDTLNQWGAKGTFFVQSRMSNLTHAYNSGHQIGSHTWRHLDLTTLSWDQVHDQMWRTELAMQRILGVSPALMRPPYGNLNNNVRAVAANRNQSIVTWDFDSGDSVGLTVQESEQRYAQIAKQHPKNILTLNHETYASTVYTLLPYALKTLSAKGYKFVTVAECLNLAPYKKSGTTYKPGKPDGSWNCN
ncbi:carbohydrate esterase family 4 protein [Sistotremastrum niveocremeum HHB9708]|uniref:Carbohydrate esterase family 4 protein n=1 Tax=Sistotremastrum niveocremeum HHB9708 TaxID=1314777 RepID=A0A164R9L3_9AGAM|nr:carbohydrate esterase family 4 protein [Sistotremastrum niveocremeum HHB9708]